MTVNREEDNHRKSMRIFWKSAGKQVLDQRMNRGTYKDGTFIGTASGYHGTVKSFWTIQKE